MLMQTDGRRIDTDAADNHKIDNGQKDNTAQATGKINSRRCKVKICGLFREEDIAYVNAAMPDFIGFVFWDKSKRRVTKEQAKRLKNKLNPLIQAVGVFVDEEREVVLDLLKEGIIDIAQLHGSETEEYIRWLKEKSGRPVIRMIRLARDTDYDMLEQTAADYLLFDSGLGSGRTFDWSLIERVKGHCHKPFFLAGGLGEDNADEAIRQVAPFALDMSSSLETDGVKDEEKIKRLMMVIQHGFEQ